MKNDTVHIAKIFPQKSLNNEASVLWEKLQ